MDKDFQKKGSVETIMGRPKSGVLSSFPKEHAILIESIRENNEGFGPDTILEEIKDEYKILGSQLPNRSTVARYLKEKGYVKRYEKHSEMPVVSLFKPKQPHEIWQLDGRGNEEAKGIGTVALLNIVDIFSSTYVQCFPAKISSPSGHPDTSVYQTALRLAFMEFGLPQKLQVDHASIFYENKSKSPFPTLFHLWIVGLGIELCYSRVHRPTDQGKVERSHQTLYNQTLKRKEAFKNFEDLINCCNKRRYKLNYMLPGKPNNRIAPLLTHPMAKHSKRYYTPCKEAELINMNLVYQFLSQGVWYRKIASNGTICLGGKVYYIPKSKPKTDLKITFCATSKNLLFHDVKDHCLVQLPIKGVSLDSLSVNLEKVYQIPNSQLMLPFY